MDRRQNRLVLFFNKTSTFDYFSCVHVFNSESWAGSDCVPGTQTEVCGASWLKRDADGHKTCPFCRRWRFLARTYIMWMTSGWTSWGPECFQTGFLKSQPDSPDSWNVSCQQQSRIRADKPDLYSWAKLVCSEFCESSQWTTRTLFSNKDKLLTGAVAT